MEKNRKTENWGEIVFGSSISSESHAIRRALNLKQLRKIAPRIYTPNLTDSPEAIIQRNLFYILGELFPGAILSHRTALEGGPTKSGLVILTYRYTKKLSLPGLTIRLIKGAAVQDGDTPFMDSLFIASRPRALLENLQSSRGKEPKSLSQEDVEIYLNKICQIHGEASLNQTRDQARELAPKLNLEKEYQKLNKIIGALLQTKPDKLLKTAVAKARSKNIPFDTSRIDLFAKLAAYITNLILPKKAAAPINKNLAFFESYFSNYIEGTEFEVDEAADIIFHHKIVKNRPEDAHDILGTYQIVHDKKAMKTTPESPDELIHLLKQRHHTLMSIRKNKHPGEFKSIANRAGNTVFVEPELVRGTIIKAFELYQNLEKGIKSAAFMMFLISEVHPFDDGNGRIARIMMNAELDCADQSRIIIPTVYRDDYLLALKRLSNVRDPEAYIDMLLRAQRFTASIDFSTYQKALEQLRKANAFMHPAEGSLYQPI